MNEAADQGGNPRSDEIDLLLLIVRLWNGKWWIVAVVALSIIVGVLTIQLTTRVYRAQALAAVATTEEADTAQRLGQLGGLAALAGISIGSGGNVEETLAVMRSREFTEKFIANHDLLPQLFPDKWDEAQGKWKVDLRQQPTLVEGYAVMDRRVRSVSQDNKTGLITVSITWPDALQAAKMANDMISQLNEELRRRAIERTDASMDFLQKELDRTTALDTRQAINRLIESQIKQRMYANVTTEYALRVVDSALPPNPKSPAAPNKTLTLLTSVVIGLAFGIALVLGMGLFKSIRGKVRALE